MARATAPRPKVLDAVYLPLGTALCPRCFSRPDIDLTAARALTDATLDAAPTGMSYTVGDYSYPAYGRRYICSNPECAAHIYVQWLVGLIRLDSVEPFIADAPLEGKPLTLFRLGHLDRRGIWRNADGLPMSIAHSLPEPIMTKQPKKKKNVPSGSPKKGTPDTVKRDQSKTKAKTKKK